MATRTRRPYGNQSNSPYYGDIVNGQMVVRDRATHQIVPGAHLTSFGSGTVVDKNGSPLQHTAANGQIGAPVKGISDLPAGSYDPSLSYASNNANLGQLYNTQDYGTQYGQPGANGAPAFAMNPDGTPADPSAQYNPDGTVRRGVQDYFTQKGVLAQALSRGQQDYTRATQGLSRQYGIQGENQLQSINAAGDLEGGALAQALAKRTANQAYDQQPIDTAWQREQQDNTFNVGQLGQQFSRGFADANVNLGRGTESNALYQGALTATASNQANNSGYFAGNPNYTSDPQSGAVYQTVAPPTQTHKGTTYTTGPTGQRTPVRRYPHPIGKSFL